MRQNFRVTDHVCLVDRGRGGFELYDMRPVPLAGPPSEIPMRYIRLDFHNLAAMTGYRNDIIAQGGASWIDSSAGAASARYTR